MYLFSVQVFLRAHFDYDPSKDTMIPCQDAGLPFKNGDVLQIVEQDDPNWWQVDSQFFMAPVTPGRIISCTSFHTHCEN